MENTDFQFDVAINSALTAWVKSNIFLSFATEHPQKLFQWKDGELLVDLNVLNNEYCQKFINDVFIEYCGKLLITIKKPLSEFLVCYSFPSVNLHVLFEYRGLKLGKSVTVLPEIHKDIKTKRYN
jgi:hypothetical protein